MIDLEVFADCNFRNEYSELVDMASQPDNPCSLITYYSLGRNRVISSFDQNLYRVTARFNERIEKVGLPYTLMSDPNMAGTRRGYILLNPANEEQNIHLAGLEGEARDNKIHEMLEARTKYEVERDVVGMIEGGGRELNWVNMTQEIRLSLLSQENGPFPNQYFLIAQTLREEGFDLEVLPLSSEAMKEFLEVFIHSNFYVDRKAYLPNSRQHLVEKATEIFQDSRTLNGFEIKPVEPVGYALKEVNNASEKQRSADYMRRRGVIQNWVDSFFPSPYASPYICEGIVRKTMGMTSREIYYSVPEGGERRLKGKVFLTLIDLKEFKDQLGFEFDPRSSFILLYDSLGYRSEDYDNSYRRTLYEIGPRLASNIQLLFRFDQNAGEVVMSLSEKQREAIYDSLKNLQKRMEDLGEAPAAKTINKSKKKLCLPIPAICLSALVE